MILPQRKSIRLKEFDYSSAGYYFITICTNNKKQVFGCIQNGSVELNEFGRVAGENLEQISDHFQKVRTDKFVIMPNHIHMILIIRENEPETYTSTNPLSEKSKQTVPKVIQQYKASVSRIARQAVLWQRGYYEHVIRYETDYLRIWDYIDTNPSQWDKDEYFT